MRRYRRAEGFNLAFLDIMSCGLGAVVLVFMLVKHDIRNSTSETEILAKEVQQLELTRSEIRQTLAQLQTIANLRADTTAKLSARLAQLEQSFLEKKTSLAKTKAQVAALKNDIAKRPVAHREDLVAADAGGEENYLVGLKIQGPRIAILLDASASMTDETLIDIIKRKNGSAGDKQQGPKWLRTKKILRWILARVPKTSQLKVIAYNSSVHSIGRGNWMKLDTAVLGAVYQELDKIVPEGATNLQKGLTALAGQGVTDLYVITDGLPTVGDSRYANLNPFSNCSSLLGKSSTISGECRVKLFRQTLKESRLGPVKVNVILLPIEGDPDAVNEYWGWAAGSGGLLISPAVNWP